MDERRCVEVLRQMLQYTMGTGVLVDEEREALDHAIATIERERWIPCSERLPEREGLGAVLAFDANRPRKGLWFETTHPSWWGEFMAETNEFGPTITHWMPLPPLPDPQPDGQEGAT